MRVVEATPTATATAPASMGRMEIVLVGGERILVGADVDATALARIVKARAAMIPISSGARVWLVLVTGHTDMRKGLVPSRVVLEFAGASSGGMRLSDQAARSMI